MIINTWDYLHYFRVCENFLSMNHKALALKSKMDRLHYITIKNFYSTKDTIKRVKG